MSAQVNDPPKYEVVTPNAVPHRASVPTGAPELLHCAVRGFEIPSLPGLEAEFKDLRKEIVRTILYRFQTYITALHGGSAYRAFALQFMSDPDEATLGARVRAYLLCRSAGGDPLVLAAEAAGLARQVEQTFPGDGVFCYGRPRALTQAELRRVLFHSSADGAVPITMAEIRKFEESQDWSMQPFLRYVPHRLWSDQQHDPWLSLIETLAQVTARTAIRIELTPVELIGKASAFITTAGRWYDVLNQDIKRKGEKGEEAKKDGGGMTEEMMREPEVRNASSNAAHVAYVKRGAHVYERLNTFAHTAFCMRVVIASEGPLPLSVIGSVRSALSTPPASADLPGGWQQPVVVEPTQGDRVMALHNLRYLAQTRWGRVTPNAAHAFDIDLRPVVTPEEAVALFHLPIYDRIGLTSAISTVDSPFVIPPEVIKATRDDEGDEDRAREETVRDAAEALGGLAPSNPEPGKKRRVVVGNLYQRDQLLDGKTTPGPTHPFHVTINDLMKPSLLVGAPGSGKTNLAFALLIELWKKHRIPFLVLDPSTGQEFRHLLKSDALKNELVVYTIGDEDGYPLVFNPFSVPPDVTVRSHTTRLLAAFRAAIDMDDPVPAIFEGALTRVYSGLMPVNEKATTDSPAPCYSDFAVAIQAELREKVLPLYHGAKDVIGSLRGMSTMRVNAIGKKLGHIINVKGNNGEFVRNLLSRPTVIEMGALGDSSYIALVMAFFLSQLAGNIEYEHGQHRTRQHVIVIEEAHRLLGAHAGKHGANKSAEDLNTMLAEVRKFGQGIMVMDQRPTSLVGGVLDNAYIKILMRLADEEGFKRIGQELNLNAAHQQYARSRLKAGDAVLLDRDSGQPVLVRGVNLKDELVEQKPGEPKWDPISLVKKNAAQLKVARPVSTPYEELPAEADPDVATKAAPAAAIPTGAPAASIADVSATPRIKQFDQELATLIREAKLSRDSWRLWFEVKLALQADDGYEKAHAAAVREMSAAEPAYRALMDRLWQDLLRQMVDDLAAMPITPVEEKQLREYVAKHRKEEILGR